MLKASGAGWSGRCMAAAAGMAMAAGLAHAQPSIGPDVTLLDVQSISNHGQVGTVRAFTLGSHTCNVGNQNLLWTNNGTPGLAMNAYRLHDGRLMQIGLSFVKTACCAAASSNPGCGSCNGAGGSVLGAGCLDVYSSGWNASQSRLGPRSAINAYTGQFSAFAGLTGDAVFRRLQVAAADLSQATFNGSQWFIEGVYVGTDDAAAGNSHNNATYKRVNVDAAGNMTLSGAPYTRIPAINSWRDHGNGPSSPDMGVKISIADIPGEGRFHYATKVTDLGNGNWRYDYAIFNLNSDRSGGSLRVPVPAGAAISDIGFHAPFYHSGEIYSNAPWTVSCLGTGEICWSSPQTFQQNANTNALRWGTMYNFWFTANTAPAAGSANAIFGLFKPGTPESITLSLPVPSAGACYPNCDDSTITPILNVADFSCFLGKFASGDPYANCDGSTLEPVLNVADFACFLQAFAAGCE
jgi:hypothetical protein